MSILRSLVLDFVRNTPLLDMAQSRFMEGHVRRMLDIGFHPSPGLDCLSDPPLPWLQWMCKAGSSTMEHPQHGIALALRSLITEGEPYEADLHLQRIDGVSASAGKTCMALDSLPETMYRIDGESFGPLPKDDMTRLRDSVYREFPAYDGIFEVTRQVWDDTYIAGNTGASRRFALWRRLTRFKAEYIRARVTPYNLNADALHVLRSHWRLIWGSGDGMIVPFMDAADIMSGTFHSFGRSAGAFWSPMKDAQFWAIPYTHRMPPQLSDLMEALHRHIDECGALDVGRYLTERISGATRRNQPEQ